MKTNMKSPIKGIDIEPYPSGKKFKVFCWFWSSFTIIGLIAVIILWK